MEEKKKVVQRASIDKLQRTMMLLSVGLAFVRGAGQVAYKTVNP